MCASPTQRAPTSQTASWPQPTSKGMHHHPTCDFPASLIPAGGRIGIDIQDTSGAQNTIELLFRGVKRYRGM